MKAGSRVAKRLRLSCLSGTSMIPAAGIASTQAIGTVTNIIPGHNQPTIWTFRFRALDGAVSMR
jgi:hypothetical protein